MNMKIKTLLLVDTKYEIIKDIFEKLKDNKKQKINVHQKLTIQPKIYDKKSGDILFILETFIYDKKMISLEIKYLFSLEEKIENISSETSRTIATLCYDKFKKLAEYLYSETLFPNFEIPPIPEK